MKAILCRTSTKAVTQCILYYYIIILKITSNLLFEYQCTSGKFIRLPNRIESETFFPRIGMLYCVCVCVCVCRYFAATVTRTSRRCVKLVRRSLRVACASCRIAPTREPSACASSCTAACGEVTSVNQCLFYSPWLGAEFPSPRFRPLSPPFIPLEVGTPIAERISPVAKRILVHFRHNIAPFWLLRPPNDEKFSVFFVHWKKFQWNIINSLSQSKKRFKAQLGSRLGGEL